jgi:hypothetical protein
MGVLKLGHNIVHDPQEKEPADAVDDIRSASKRDATYSVKGPAVVPKHAVAEHWQNEEPHWQKCYCFNHPEK